MNNQVKTCCECKILQPLSNFYKKKSGKFGVTGKCKTCLSIDQNKYSESNKAKIQEQKKIYREANREKLIEVNRQYYKNNREECLDRQKEYARDNKEKISFRKKKYREKNKDHIREHQREYYYKRGGREKNIESSYRWSKANPEKVKIIRENRKDKHKKYTKEWYLNNRQQIIETSRNRTKKLDDRYVVFLLKSQLNLKADDITLDIISSKKEQLRACRLLREYNKKS